jgi:hypothetical protein
VHAAPPAVSLSNNNLVSAAPGSTSAAGGGEPMHSPTQSVLESSYSANLHSVRVHSDSHGQDLAQGLSARAVTYGNHIFLGPGERQTDLRLMAHETAHVLQQRAAPVVHLWAPGAGGNSYEHEAHQAADAVMRHESFSVQQQTSKPQAQRLGLSDALDYFADKANLIPGFRMFTIVLGMNPINGASVDRSPGNIIRAIVEFLPGGGFVVQALESSGVFDKVGNWVAGQLKSLGMVGSAFKQGIMDFLHSLSWRDIFNLGGVWERAKAIFTGPISQLINFVKGLITGIIQFIKDAILKPLAKLAEGTEGYNLLKGILGKDPITGEAVPRSAETLLGPLLRMIGLGDVWQKMQQARAVPRAWAWFQSTMGQLVGFVSQIPGLFIAAFKSLTIEDIILIPKAFAKLAKVFGGFLGKFVSWGLDAMFKLLEIVFDVVSPGAFGYIKKTGAALKQILKNPLPFIGNLVKAAKLGFQNFGGNFLTHLKKGLIDWLTGSLEGVYIPKALSLPEFGKLAISVLGVSWAQIRAKIVKALGPSGETIMKVLETTFDIVVALVTGGPAAAWDLIKDKLTELKDQVVDGIIGFIKETVVTKAIPKLIAMFIPGAGFISAIISIYDTVMVFINKISKIIQVVTAFLNSIVAIAAGNIGAAAAKVESILAGLLSLAISFLAGFVGLGKVTGKIMEVVNKVRAKVDKALDLGVNWVVSAVKKLGGMIKGKDARTPEEKQRDLDKAGKEIKPKVREIFSKGPPGRLFKLRLAVWKRQYRLTDLKVSAAGAVTGSINPTQVFDNLVSIPKQQALAVIQAEIIAHFGSGTGASAGAASIPGRGTRQDPYDPAAAGTPVGQAVRAALVTGGARGETSWVMGTHGGRPVTAIIQRPNQPRFPGQGEVFGVDEASGRRQKIGAYARSLEVPGIRAAPPVASSAATVVGSAFGGSQSRAAGYAGEMAVEGRLGTAQTSQEAHAAAAVNLLGEVEAVRNPFGALTIPTTMETTARSGVTQPTSLAQTMGGPQAARGSGADFRVGEAALSRFDPATGAPRAQTIPDPPARGVRTPSRAGSEVRGAAQMNSTIETLSQTILADIEVDGAVLVLTVADIEKVRERTRKALVQRYGKPR